MEQKQRLAFIDRAKGIGILMVVFSHMSSMTGFGNRLWTWYNPFMLTLFFMIAGGMRRYRDERGTLGARNAGAGGTLGNQAAGEDFLSFVKRRAYALLLPYFVFDILALGIQTVLSYWRGGVPEAVLKLQTGAARIFTFRGLGPDWFLPSLFAAEVLLDLCLRAGGKTVSEVRGYCRSDVKEALSSGGRKARVSADQDGPAGVNGGEGQSLPVTAAALFAVSVIAVFCLGGDRLAVLGPFRCVLVKSLAAAGFLVLGYVCMPMARKVPVLPAAVLSLAGTLLIAGRYNLDFNQLDFGSRPLLLYADTLCGTCFVLCISRIPDLLSGNLSEKLSAWFGAAGQPGLLQEFGRESLTIMCTHLEWQIVPIIHFGWAAVAGMAPQEGKRFYAEMLVKLCLVMAAELGLVRTLHSLMPWLYRGRKTPR